MTNESFTDIFNIPHGRIIEVFGAESSGKTTLTLQIIAGDTDPVYPGF
jgi:RecA/RadA recombinase